MRYPLELENGLFQAMDGIMVWRIGIARQGMVRDMGLGIAGVEDWFDWENLVLYSTCHS